MEQQEINNTTTRMDWNTKRREPIRGVSFYGMLWLILSVLSVSIIIIISVAMFVAVSSTYKTEVAKELKEQSLYIEMDVASETPRSFDGNHSEYIRYLSTQYDANIFVVDRDGDVVYPFIPDFSAGESVEVDDYSQELAKLREELEKSTEIYALYEWDNAYIYGKAITLMGGGDSEFYLYIEKPLEFIQNAFEQIVVRMVSMAVILSILALAISSVLAAWVVKPITAITEKANMLAEGNFSVEFRGKAYSREIAELAQTLDFARKEISKTDELQKELIANISHDFKTPLTMVKAYAAMIMEISGEVKEKRDKHAQVIMEEADRLTALVTDLLDLSKLRAGVQLNKQTTVDMSSYAQEVIERFTYLQETQGYCFQVDVDADLYTTAEEVAMGQVLYNLIGNAINYTGADKTVYISLKKTTEDTFRFAVRDTGKGIKEEDLQTIWDRYYRASEMHKRPVKGTGLGLSIVKAVLLRHDLNFGVESELGKGSTFFVDFPLLGEEEG